MGAWRRFSLQIPGVLLLAGAWGCSLDGLLQSDKLPSGVSDPALIETPSGALAAYVGALAQFRQAWGGTSEAYITQAGLLSDELTVAPNGVNSVDQRLSGGADTYAALHQLRGRASQAIGLLRDYRPEAPALAGHLYALQGYAELFLAELFCSGVPLGTLDYRGDFTYRPGSTTTEVLTHAVALFDTALALGSDSARVVTLAQVGRGRAFLGMGEYAAASAAVAAVPDGYRYEVLYGDSTAKNFAARPGTGTGTLGDWGFSVPDREGSNGLPWRTSGDPRTPVEAQGLGDDLRYYPTNYDPAGTTPLVLASGVEARLIEAEAALQIGSSDWLTKLNALRTDGTFTVDSQAVIDNTVSPPDTTGWTYDTLWHAGSGGTAGLRPLEDPGTAGGRVDLLFHERAFWLFLTGHRQGDLRRLIRQYGRSAETLYPVGFYRLGGGGAGNAVYQSEVTLPIPDTESANPLFTGCLSRDA